MYKKRLSPEEKIHFIEKYKETAIHDYLSGVDSQDAICRKYGLRSRRQLQDWIMKYNSHEELKPSGTGGSTIVTKGRKVPRQN